MATRYFTNILLFFLLSFSSIIQAQIAKGVKSIDGSGLNIAFRGRSFDQKNTGDAFRENLITHALSIGGFHYCINDKWQIGTGFSLTTNSDKTATTKPNVVEETRNTFSNYLIVSPAFRYYFLKKKNKTYFFEVGSNITYLRERTRFAPVIDESNSSDVLANYLGIVGYLNPINDNVAWVNTLGYERGNTGSNTVFVNARLQNFITQLPLKKNGDAPPQLLSKNRSLFNGSADLRYYFDTDLKFTTALGYEQLRFIRDNVAIGGYAYFSHFFFTEREKFTYISTGVKARYFIPINQRWYIYPELGYGLSSQFEKGHSFSGFVIRRVGVNYFINPNLAFEVNLDLSLSNNKWNSENGLNPPNISRSYDYSSFIHFGFNYFVDKVFRKKNKN
jgi:hypothetical protein